MKRGIEKREEDYVWHLGKDREYFQASWLRQDFPLSLLLMACPYVWLRWLERKNEEGHLLENGQK